MKSKFKILIVDDEENIVSFLKMGLEVEGFTVYCAYDGKEAIEMARDVNPHLVILDIMLPEVNGYDVCKAIKSSIDTSIIMLTARDDVDDKVRGLDIGADDYMAKPFSYKELIARINARLRNVLKEDSNIIKVGKFVINNGAHEVKYGEEILELSPTEYNLLVYLLRNNGMVLSKSKILDNVWGYDFYGDENVVEVYIRYLRNKLGDKGYEIIKTIRGAGYRVVANED